MSDPAIRELRHRIIMLERAIRTLGGGGGTPGAHASSHENGGSDEIDVTGLTGLLATAQTPAAHATSHQNAGTDEISVTGLSGLLADAQAVTIRKNSGADVGTRPRLNLIEGSNVTLTVADDGANTEVDVTIAASGGGGNAFGTVAVSGQSDVVADQSNDTLTLVAGSNVTLTTDATTDAVTIAATGGSSDSFKTIAVSGQSDVVADSSTDTLTLAAGSNVTLTTNAGTDTITIASTGGGSGDSTLTAAYASRPAASNDGNLFLPNDGFVLERDTGAVYAPWGPIYPFTAPVDGDFSWINQSTASVSTTNGGIILTCPEAGSGDYDLAIRMKSAPSTPYTISVYIHQSLTWNNFFAAGLVFRQSSDGKLVFFGNEWNTFGAGGTANYFRIFTLSSPTASNAAVQNEAFPWLFHWLRIEDDGTNRKYHISHDGQNWVQWYTEGRTTYLTADQVGFCLNRRNTNGTARTRHLNLLSWKEA